MTDVFLKKVRESNVEHDIKLIEKAYEKAICAHCGQKRMSGEDYVIHPIAVAELLFEMGMDSESIAAALLHDVVEDCDVTFADLTKEFGTSIAKIVDGVTKLGKLQVSSHEEMQAENIRKILIATSDDVRVILVKLADRLHNMRTIEHLSESKQRILALETIEVYAPIAHRLGVTTIKEELEDLSIKILDPIGYEEIENILESKNQYREGFLEGVGEKIAGRVSELNIKSQIEGRFKSIHGIYRKMFMQGRNFDEIYDIYAVRVIVNTVADCYNVLGIVHDIFRPIPNRFKDYISTPKPNLYQSLHTTVISRDGINFEVQIRTFEMHKQAELGIASHWKYKEGIESIDARIEQRLLWVRQLLEAQQESSDSSEIVRSIKIDLDQEDVFCMTPKGDVISLPPSSTVIDFAYAIHTEVGNKMQGAKVDGKIVPLTFKLQTGQVVEIITGTNARPRRDWLSSVRTSGAKSKIRSWFKRERKEQNIIAGKVIVEKELKRARIRLSESQLSEILVMVAESLHLTSVDDLYAALGYRGISLTSVLNKIRAHYEKISGGESPAEVDLANERISQKRKPTIEVEGLKDCLVKLSSCCNPLPGDDIIGFITRGHGVSVHKCSCHNVPQDLSDYPERERFVNVAFKGTSVADFKSDLEIYAIDRAGLLNEVMTTLTNLKIAVFAINARKTSADKALITASISVSSAEHLRTVVAKLNKIMGVISTVRK